MMILSTSERGMTLISFLILAAIAGFLIMLTVKIGPIYLDHYNVVASLQALKSDPDLFDRSKDEIYRSLEKRWDINYVEGITKDNVIITKDYQKLVIQVKYDVIRPIMGNVSALVQFDDSIEASRH